MKKHTRKGYRIGRTSALDYVLVVILGLESSEDVQDVFMPKMLQDRKSVV